MAREYDGKDISMFLDEDGDNVKATMKIGACSLKGIVIYNPSNAVAFVQIYDLLIGSVTVGTTQANLSIAAKSADVPTVVMFSESGVPFNTGISYACTTTVGGSSDPSTGLVINAFYIA